MASYMSMLDHEGEWCSQDNIIINDYDHVMNHPRRNNTEGHHVWQMLRGKREEDRRRISLEEAQRLLILFETQRIAPNGNLIQPRLWKRSKKMPDGKFFYRGVTLKEIQANVHSKRAKESKKRKTDDGLPDEDLEPIQLAPILLQPDDVVVASDSKSEAMEDDGVHTYPEEANPGHSWETAPASDALLPPSRTPSGATMEIEETLREYIHRYVVALHDMEERKKRYRSESQVFRKILDGFQSMPYSDLYPSEQSRLEYYGYIAARSNIDSLWLQLNSIYRSSASSTEENASFDDSSDSPGSNNENSSDGNDSSDDDYSPDSLQDGFGGKTFFPPEGGGQPDGFDFGAWGKVNKLREGFDDASSKNSEEESAGSDSSGVLVERPEGIRSDGTIEKLASESIKAPLRKLDAKQAATRPVGPSEIDDMTSKFQMSCNTKTPATQDNIEYEIRPEKVATQPVTDCVKQVARRPVDSYEPPKPWHESTIDNQKASFPHAARRPSVDEGCSNVASKPIGNGLDTVRPDSRRLPEDQDVDSETGGTKQNNRTAPNRHTPNKQDHSSYPREDLQQEIKNLYRGGKKVSFADTGSTEETVTEEQTAATVSETTVSHDTVASDADTVWPSSTSSSDNLVREEEDAEGDLDPGSGHSTESSVQVVKDLVKDLRRPPKSSRMIAEVVLECMRTNKTANAQEHCLKIIWENCKEDKVTVEAFMSMDAPRDIVSAMRDYKEFKVMKNGCGALWSMCADSPTTTRLVDLGACEQVLDALRLFGDNKSLSQYATGALQSFSVERMARKTLRECNACDAVINAMEQHKLCYLLQKHGCKFLSNCSIAMQGQTKVRNSEVPTAAVGAVALALLNHHAGNGSLKKEACLALKNFTYDEKKLAALCDFKQLSELHSLLQDLCQVGKDAAAAEHAAAILKRLHSGSPADPSPKKPKPVHHPAKQEESLMSLKKLANAVQDTVQNSKSGAGVQAFPRGASVRSEGTATTTAETIEESIADDGTVCGPKHLGDDLSIGTGVTAANSSMASTVVSSRPMPRKHLDLPENSRGASNLSAPRPHVQ